MAMLPQPRSPKFKSAGSQIQLGFESCNGTPVWSGVTICLSMSPSVLFNLGSYTGSALSVRMRAVRWARQSAWLARSRPLLARFFWLQAWISAGGIMPFSTLTPLIISNTSWSHGHPHMFWYLMRNQLSPISSSSDARVGYIDERRSAKENLMHWVNQSYLKAMLPMSWVFSFGALSEGLIL